MIAIQRAGGVNIADTQLTAFRTWWPKLLWVFDAMGTMPIPSSRTCTRASYGAQGLQAADRLGTHFSKGRNQIPLHSVIINPPSNLSEEHFATSR